MFRPLPCIPVVLACGLLATPAFAKPDGYYVAKAKKEMSECIAGYTPGGGSSVLKLTTDVESLKACVGGGFQTRVNLYAAPNCQPNKPCLLILPKLLAQVDFDCDGEIMNAVCQALVCSDDAECSPDSWCRPTQYGHTECTPYVKEGDTCGGYTLAWLYEQCDPSLTCVTDPKIPDLPGECAVCNFNGTPVPEGTFDPGDGCNTCWCSPDGFIACTDALCG